MLITAFDPLAQIVLFSRGDSKIEMQPIVEAMGDLNTLLTRVVGARETPPGVAHPARPVGIARLVGDRSSRDITSLDITLEAVSVACLASAIARQRAAPIGLITGVPGDYRLREIIDRTGEENENLPDAVGQARAVLASNR